ncbi:MAG TPA: sulfatase [Chitinophagaceae bacterium]|nr:sulfatase [Chitinophagaceae bacterium]
MIHTHPVTLLISAAVVICFSSFQAKPSNSGEGKPERRPNIIVIVTDDQRWDMMGCAGNSIIQTPNMDKMASEGVRFSHAFSSTPICAASRASILTGLYERKHGFSFGTPPVSQSHSDISYPYLLKKAGYQTGFVGKLGVKFDVSVDSLFNWKRINGFPYWKVVDGKKTFLTDIQTDQAIEFIKNSSSGDPFCLSLSFSAPHADDDSKEQYFWPQELDSLYQHAIIPVPSTAAPAFYEGLPDFLKGTMSRERWYWRFDTPEKYQNMVKGYYRMITGIDQALGRIRNTLDELGIADNTIIMLMGDNGYFLGDRGLADKWLMHEASIRVPFIYFDPRNKVKTGNGVVSNMVLNIDVSPTVLELAGISIPKIVQGESLVPTVTGKNVKKRSSVFCEHLMNNPKIPNSEGIRTEKWKFIRYPKHPEFVELYDLENDPWEEKNLAGDARYRKNISHFQRECDKRIAQLSNN